MSTERFQRLFTLVSPTWERNIVDHGNTLQRQKSWWSHSIIYPQETHSSLNLSCFLLVELLYTILERNLCRNFDSALKQIHNASAAINKGVKIAQEFRDQHGNFLGGIDGKNIMIECPKNVGSTFYSYKGCHRIASQAICDAKYCCTHFDIGAIASTINASILSELKIGRIFEESTTAFIILRKSSHNDKLLPFVVIGEDISPLGGWLMKPYTGQNLQECHSVHNYRLSRARHCIENAFGILSARWRIFRRPIKGNVDLVKKIVVCLHNYLFLNDNTNYTQTGFVDRCDTSGNIIQGDWKYEVGNM